MYIPVPSSTDESDVGGGWGRDVMHIRKVL